MDALMNKLNSLTSFSQPNYKRTSAYFNSKISSIVTDEVSDCIGLDFGNSNICVSYYKNQVFHVFQLESQSNIMPAWLTLKEKEFFSGIAAKNTQHQKSTKLTVFALFLSDIQSKVLDIRRAMSATLPSIIGVPYQLTKEQTFVQNGVTIPVVRVIAILFAAIKDKIEKTLKEEIKKVVLTIPSSFEIKLQQLLVDACQIANLKVVKLLFEPVATAITYYSLKKSERKTICVIDFGGGKLDVANFIIEDGKIELLSNATDLELGGRDFDERLVNHIISFVTQKYPDKKINDLQITLIREKCILVKESLTDCPQKGIEIDLGDDDITINITRADFEKLCDDLFKRALSIINRAVTQIDKSRLSDIVLVGGSSRMPKFQMDIQQLFQNIPVNVTLNADEAIAKGACIYGASKSGLIKKIKVEDRVSWKGKTLRSPKVNTFVDGAGVVQQKIIEFSVSNNTDVKHEQAEIQKIFVKHQQISNDYNKTENDGTAALIEKYLSPDFARRYDQQGYHIVAIDTLKDCLQQNLDDQNRAQIAYCFIQRIEVCLKAIELFQTWVPGRFSECLILEYEMKKLCLYSSSMDPTVLETNVQYLNLVRFYLEKKYAVQPFFNNVSTEPSISLLGKIVMELKFMYSLLENFHQTNQRIYYDVQKLSELINSFFRYNKPIQ